MSGSAWQAFVHNTDTVSFHKVRVTRGLFTGVLAMLLSLSYLTAARGSGVISRHSSIVCPDSKYMRQYLASAYKRQNVFCATAWYVARWYRAEACWDLLQGLWLSRFKLLFPEGHDSFDKEKHDESLKSFPVYFSLKYFQFVMLTSSAYVGRNRCYHHGACAIASFL